MLADLKSPHKPQKAASRPGEVSEGPFMADYDDVARSLSRNSQVLINAVTGH
jgi:hypothetical protein